MGHYGQALMTSPADAGARPASRPDARALDSVYDRLRERVAAGDVPAAALAVGNSNGLIRSEAFAAHPRDRLDVDSFFFLASLTKPIFATAFMRLVEDGLLELREPIARWLPEFDTPDARERREVTAWHLLTHTSGLPDIHPEQIRASRPSAARMLEMTLSAPLNFRPGSRFEYCSATYYLLGELIHRLSGVPYPTFLAEQVLRPLGMQATFDPRGGGRRLVFVHGVGAEGRLRRWLLLRYIVSIAVPGGGLWGTLDDLLRFGAALLRPQRRDGNRYVPLGPSTIEQMMADHLGGRVSGVFDGEERPVHFGLAWNKPTLMPEIGGSARVVSHGGATGTLMWIDPDSDLVVIYFSNQWDADRAPEREALQGVYAALQRATRG